MAGDEGLEKDVDVAISDAPEETVGLSDEDWSTLVTMVRTDACVPFLGAGVSAPFLPLGADLARRWAAEHHYPFRDEQADLTRVSQFLAVKRSSELFPKIKVIEEITRLEAQVDVTDTNLNHLILANMRFPLYISDELRRPHVQDSGQGRHARRPPDGLSMERRDEEGARHSDRLHTGPPDRVSPAWMARRQGLPGADRRRLHQVSQLPRAQPGHRDTRNNSFLPRVVVDRITHSAFLFLGYRLTDPTFRVIFHVLVGAAMKRRYRHVAVQLAPTKDLSSREEALEYLRDYFDGMNVAVYWGTAQQFLRDFREKLAA